MTDRESRLVESKTLLEVRGLYVSFVRTRGERVRAVDGVDLSIAEGETVGLVGESGCGKTTLGRSIVRLVEPDAGRILFDGTDVLAASPRELRVFRRCVQLVFQDCGGSLDPRMRVGEIVAQPLVVQKACDAARLPDRVAKLLASVALDEELADRYAHELSGGQRQRVGIARALALEPRLLILDEPVSALDVSVQAQIINLLTALRSRLGLAYLFISHDLAVVRHLADRVAVMYAGRIVELAPTDELFNRPRHPYTIGLLEASPWAGARSSGGGWAPGAPKGLPDGRGCPYQGACRWVRDECRDSAPPLEHKAGMSSGHHVACVLTESPAAV